MAVPLRRGGGVKAVRKKLLYFSDGEVPTAIKLEGGGGGFPISVCRKMTYSLIRLCYVKKINRVACPKFGNMP